MRVEVESMQTLMLTAAGLALGSLPLAWWLGRTALHVDVRDYGGDRNPGAGNVWRAGGWKMGLAAAFLDVGKATPAVLAARAAGLSGWSLVPVALAPAVGHAFSPFLGFRGGKGVACTFGSWIGLAGPLGGLALAVCFAVFYAAQRTDAWTNVLGTGLFALVLIVVGAGGALVATAGANLLLLAWTSRGELREAPRPRWVRPAPRRP
jgi:glycerol-3-phosphate acyltransferase PlsY